MPDEWVSMLGRRPLGEGDIFLPRFINPDNGKPMYVHRKGSNVANSEYYTDSIPQGTIAHYSSFYSANPEVLRQLLRETEALDAKQLQENSPLEVGCYQRSARMLLPSSDGVRRQFGMLSVDAVISSLDEVGRWLTVFNQISNPYQPIPSTMSASSEDRSYAQKMVGDEYDTCLTRTEA